MGALVSKPSDIFRELRPTLSLAFPIIIGQVSQMLMGITDSVMIGRVGVVPLAASSFASAVFGVAYIMGIGLLLPVAVLVARAHGQQQPRECAEYLRHGMGLGVATGVVGAGAMLALVPWFPYFGQPAEVVTEVGPYFRVIALSLVPTLMYQVLRQFSEAMGHPWSAMVVLLLCVGLNAFLNWVLIWGHLGAPALGLEGAGWATLISRCVAVAALWVWLHHYKDVQAAWPASASSGEPADASASVPLRRDESARQARQVANSSWLAKFDRPRLREMMSLGVPACGQLLFEAGAFTAAALMMGWLGTVPLAAHQVAINCASATFMVPLGLALATSVRIGKTVGEGRREALRPIGYGAIGAGVAFMAVAAVNFAIFGFWLARAFTPEQEVVLLAAQLLVIAAIFQMFDGAQVIGAAALRGLTDVKVPTVITFVAYWVIALPAGYLLAFRTRLGPWGVWAGLAVGLACAAVLLAWRFRHKTARIAPAS
jgi:MATE family multidrug resistance protein